MRTRLLLEALLGSRDLTGRVLGTEPYSRALHRIPQRALARKLLLGMFICRIQERLSCRDQMCLHAFHLFERDGTQDVFEMVEFGGTDTNAEFGVVENVREWVVRSIAHEHWNAACINGVLHSERPAYIDRLAFTQVVRFFGNIPAIPAGWGQKRASDNSFM
jgi:hypothetical protein